MVQTDNATTKPFTLPSQETATTLAHISELGCCINYLGCDLLYASIRMCWFFLSLDTIDILS